MGGTTILRSVVLRTMCGVRMKISSVFCFVSRVRVNSSPSTGMSLKNGVLAFSVDVRFV